MVSLLIAAGAPVNVQSQDGETPIFTIHAAAEGTIDVVTTLLRAGASLDYTDREGSTHSFEEHLNIIYQVAYRGNIIAISSSFRSFLQYALLRTLRNLWNVYTVLCFPDCDVALLLDQVTKRQIPSFQV